MQKQQYSWDEAELRAFKDCVLKEKGLKCRTDDIFLLSFLRAKKYDREKALKLLKDYYSIRKSVYLFKDLRPSSLEKYLKMNIMSILRIPPDQVIGIGRVSHWNASEVSILDIERCVLLLMDLELNDHPLQVNGIIILIDVKTLSWRHLIQFTPRIIHLVMSCCYHCQPIRYNAVHVVNVNKYFSAIATLFFPFLPYKLKKRLHFHSSGFENIHKEIDPKYLPAEFGGELPPFDATAENQRLFDNEEYFIENEKYWT